MINLILEVLEQGLIFSILAFGVYMTYKILDFPDLTADGSFVLGASIFGSMLVKGINPWFAILSAMVGGALAGLLTGLLHVKLKISALLAGILVMTGLYSINLRVMKKPNLPLFSYDNVFTKFSKSLGLDTGFEKLIVLVMVVLLLKVLFDTFFKTKIGMLLHTVGDNPHLLAQLHSNLDHLKLVGLMIANALVALAGAMMAQHQRFTDVNSGSGMMVIGLASIIIGLTLFKGLDGRFLKPSSMMIVGAIIYRGLQALTLQLGFESSDFKLISAILVVLALAVSNEPWKGMVKKKRQVTVEKEVKERVRDQITSEIL